MTKTEFKQYLDCITVIDNAEALNTNGFGDILARMDMVAVARDLELTSVVVDEAIYKAMECDS